VKQPHEGIEGALPQPWLEAQVRAVLTGVAVPACGERRQLGDDEQPRRLLRVRARVRVRVRVRVRARVRARARARARVRVRVRVRVSPCCAAFSPRTRLASSSSTAVRHCAAGPRSPMAPHVGRGGPLEDAALEDEALEDEATTTAGRVRGDRFS
jgi:hypothetical protein